MNIRILLGGVAFAFVAVSSHAALPLDQRAARADEWGYRPADGATVALNPPSFTWVAPANATKYAVQWSREGSFPAAATTTIEDVVWPTYTHEAALAPGRYYWRYRAVTAQGEVTEWSRARQVEVPPTAATLPMPTVAQQRAKVPAGHPRLFLRPEDLPRLRELARGRESASMAALRKAADAYIQAGPTPEPEHKGSARDKDNPELIKYWWPNRAQTEKACEEAETIAFVYLMTGEAKYGAAARRWVLHLASWDPKGNTNFTLNCEAGKPMLYRPARAYDWAWDQFTAEDRAKVQAAMRARVIEAWNSGEVQRGVGHLQRPFGSHANRVWHKLAEAGIAFLDEIPEAPQWLDYAVNKFFACYPVWSDDDGGWHEGVSYWSGYQNKVVWWLQVAQSALGLDGMKKPFFAQVGDYPLYLAPPHSPNAGFGDLSFRPITPPSFMEYHARARSVSGDGGHAGIWYWWAKSGGMAPNTGFLGFLYRANLPPLPSPRPPSDLPPSKIFNGIGVASLHTTLLDSRDDVHFALKASPFGSQSHGHNPQNSFLLNAYGDALLVANGYRDLHGSKFHYQFVHTTRAQNAVLVNGEGQIPHSVNSTGRIVREQLGAAYDYVAGDATPAYGKRLTKAWRHVVFVKGETPYIVLYDELVAPAPATFQFMLHALKAFSLDEAGGRMRLDLSRAGLEIAYLSPVPLKFTQTDGFSPPPTREFPNLWHVEAATTEKRAALGVVTVLVPHRAGQKVTWRATHREAAGGVSADLVIGGRQHTVVFPSPGGEQPVMVMLAAR
ncbi:MAG: DUF4962 domain-containing protein [Verrucomicrobia bacterium]|nr:DUF4962 domain-containing protein [Verrucomicrobiota bacterium]